MCYDGRVNGIVWCCDGVQGQSEEKDEAKDDDMAEVTNPRKIVIAFLVVGLTAMWFYVSQSIAQTTHTSEWNSRAPLIEPNSEMAVALLDGKIYVIGGYPSTRISVDTAQVYDISSNSWGITTPYPTTINHASAVGLDGTLYVIGGQTNAGGRKTKSLYTSAVYAFDPKTKAWTIRAPMPTARSAMAHDVINGKVYVAGGRPPRGNDFAVYDPKADKWTTLPDLPTARNHMAAAGIDGKRQSYPFASEL